MHEKLDSSDFFGSMEGDILANYVAIFSSQPDIAR